MWIFSFSDDFYRHKQQICGAHNKSETNTSVKAKKRQSHARGMAPSVVSVVNTQSPLKKVLLHRKSLFFLNMQFVSFLQDNQQSVTVVLFRDSHTLISSGAVDG